jgi:hypothetical protein
MRGAPSARVDGRVVFPGWLTMARMADQPDASMPAAGARAAPEAEARTGTWWIGLAALGLAAVIGGLAAGVESVSGEPRPPDLGGPILAPGAVSTSAPPARTSPVSPSAGRPARLPPLVRTDGAGNPRGGAAAPVPVRALPVAPGPPGAGRPSTTAAAPGSPPNPPAAAPAERSVP